MDRWHIILLISDAVASSANSGGRRMARGFDGLGSLVAACFGGCGLSQSLTLGPDLDRLGANDIRDHEVSVALGRLSVGPVCLSLIGFISGQLLAIRGFTRACLGWLHDLCLHRLGTKGLIVRTYSPSLVMALGRRLFLGLAGASGRIQRRW